MSDISDRKSAQQALQRSNRALRAIRKCIQLVVRATSEQQLLDEVCRLMIEVGSYRLAWVGMAETDAARSVRIVARAGLGSDYLESLRITWADGEFGRGPTGTAIRERRVELARDIQGEAGFGPWRTAALQHGLRSSIALPLLVDDAHCLGAWNVYAAEPDAFDADEVQLLAELASDLAYGVRALRDRCARDRAEQAQGATALRLQHLLGASPTILYALRVTAGGLVPTEVSDNVERILGYPRAEVLRPEWWHACLHPEDRDRAVAAGTALIAHRGGGHDYRLVHRNGGHIWVHDELRLVRDADHQLTEVVGSWTDITERRQAEMELRESEERLRLALHAANQGLYDLDVQTGAAKVSPEYALMLGYDPEHFQETNAAWIARLHEDDREPVAALYRDYIAGKIPEYRVEFRQRTASGGWKWILSLGRILERDAQGRPLRMLGTHTDITDRKRAEEQLRRLEQYRRAIIDAEPDCVKVVARDGTLLDMNPAGLAQLEVGSLAEVERQTLVDFLAPEHRAAFRDLHARVMQGEAGQLEFELLGRKGTRRWMATHAVPMRDANGDIHAMLGITQDITARKRSERERQQLQEQLLQAQKMESIGRLAGGVAHDFNNLLSVILGYTELAMLRLDKADPLRADLEQIQTAGQRSAGLTRRLLAFARKQPVAPRILDLNATIAGMLGMLGRMIGEGIELVFQPGIGLASVEIDPAQVDQILTNLALNARDALGGVGQITIATANVSIDEPGLAEDPSLPAGDYVQLVVSDNGCGMDEESRRLAFEPFFTTKGVGRGTGLGLATVFGIVRQNGGSILLDSEPGKGTKFRIYLPRCRRTSEPTPAPSATTLPRVGGETVLLVEDNVEVLQLARTMLEGLGYEVLVADSPAAALQLAGTREGTIDLLLTDLVMPGMSGRELAERLALTRPATKALFMSGYTADVIIDHGVHGENLPLLPKPFTLAELADRVRQELDRA